MGRPNRTRWLFVTSLSALSLALGLGACVTLSACFGGPTSDWPPAKGMPSDENDDDKDDGQDPDTGGTPRDGGASRPPYGADAGSGRLMDGGIAPLSPCGAGSDAGAGDSGVGSIQQELLPRLPFDAGKPTFPGDGAQRPSPGPDPSDAGNQAGNDAGCSSAGH